MPTIILPAGYIDAKIWEIILTNVDVSLQVFIGHWGRSSLWGGCTHGKCCVSSSREKPLRLTTRNVWALSFLPEMADYVSCILEQYTAERSEAEASPAAMSFNCAQRNMLNA